MALSVTGGSGVQHPTEAMARTLRKVLREMMLLYPHARVVTHTQGNAELGVASAKQCPGRHAEPMVKAAASWAALAARHMRRGPSRW